MIDFGGLFRRLTAPELRTPVEPPTPVLREHQLLSRYIDSEEVVNYVRTNYGDRDLRGFEMIEVDAQYWIIWLPFELTKQDLSAIQRRSVRPRRRVEKREMDFDRRSTLPRTPPYVPSTSSSSDDDSSSTSSSSDDDSSSTSSSSDDDSSSFASSLRCDSSPMEF